jgi:hypothetical protein
MEDKIVYEIGPTAGESGDSAPKLGSVPWQLTHDPLYREEEPMWSANEKRIFFGCIRWQGHKSLCLVGANSEHRECYKCIADL